MTNDNSEDARVKNERSFKAIVRSLHLGSGQFSLLLLRCNYAKVRHQVAERLRRESPVKILELNLPQSLETLYHTIAQHVQQERSGVAGLMIFGLESVQHLERILSSTNQVRENYRNEFPFPLLLWVTDDVLRILMRRAPDFESWATNSEFVPSTEELIAHLEESATAVFNAVISSHSDRATMGKNFYIPNRDILGSTATYELESACRDLRRRAVELSPQLKAKVEFLRGRDDYADDRLDEAVAKYQSSLAYWQQEDAHKTPSPDGDTWQGVLLFHLGLCCDRRAQLQRKARRQHWQEMRQYLEQCVEILEAADRPDLVARFIGVLGATLECLEDWEALSALATKSLKLDEEYGYFHNLARDYGFLAEVALHQSQWDSARHWAVKALASLAGGESAPQLYLLLARALFPLNQQELALENLETARRQSEPEYDLQLHLRILRTLRDFYFQRGDYASAFQIKQEQRSIEAQFGLRAFIGAGRLQSMRYTVNPASSQGIGDSNSPQSPLETGGMLKTSGESRFLSLEIVASGRQRDLDCLIGRLGRDDYKLTVIHGPSGVGKSSLVNAGLVPALKQQGIGDRLCVPVVVQVYTDWITTTALNLSPVPSSPSFLIPNGSGFGIDRILHILRQNGERNQLTVLIFDQFEEFFFANPQPQKQQEFYEFLRHCMNVPYVKIIISLREDYLHYLLVGERLGIMEEFGQDILCKEIRYYLGNFTREDARMAIKKLTDRSQFYLQPELIDELVNGLSQDLDSVRPIELQLVGAQLQAEKITTLEEYRQSGPKERLIEKFLEEVIKDCGPENEYYARILLYFLTEENGVRPLKTKADLIVNLDTHNSEQINLILHILVASGLVYLIPDFPANRYQLVHDYLVNFIRQQEQVKNRAELKALRAENQQLQKEKKLLGQLAEAKEKEQQIESRLNKSLRIALGSATVSLMLGVAMFAGVGVLWQRAERESMKAESAARSAEIERQKAATAEIEALSSASRAFMLSQNQLQALVASVKAARKIPANNLLSEIKSEAVHRLYQAAYKVAEKNRLENHNNSVLGVVFSPDGQLIATASADKTVKIWNPQGRELATLATHQDGVNGVAFSPDSKMVASASWDKTVKIWRVSRNRVEAAGGSEVATLAGHTDRVISVAWSPDGQYIATASGDNTVKIWRVARNQVSTTPATETWLISEVRTLTGHQDWVLDVHFSPNGQTIASASRDGTVKLWRLDGRIINTIDAHNDGVLAVTFSPDGKNIATGGADSTAKIWDSNGNWVTTLKGNEDWVRDVNFSPDGSLLATASKDNTIRLWRRDGVFIRVLRGHRDQVFSVNFSADGKTIASASKDNSVKLWTTASRDLPGIRTHQAGVLAVSFSPNGSLLATASKDKTAKIFPSHCVGNEVSGSPSPEVSESPHLRVPPVRERSRTASASLRVSESPPPPVSPSPSPPLPPCGQPIALTGHADWVTGLGWSPDGKFLATASRDKTVKIWKTDGTLAGTLTGHADRVNSVTWSPDGHLVATSSEDNTVKLWQVDGTLRQNMTPGKKPINNVSFSPHGEVIAISSADGTVQIWRREAISAPPHEMLNYQYQQTILAHQQPVWTVTFSPDGSLIATASADNTVKIWNRNGQRLQTLEGHIGPVNWVAFSPDGKTLASASDDNTVKLWSSATGKVLGALEGHTDKVFNLNWRPDGKFIASASDDETVLLWNLDAADLERVGCVWLQDYLQNNVNVKPGERTLCTERNS
uniref:Novel STAND NTPase 1 domain-containing protein n=1 Tax=Planktothricoides sp. SpSt-374 TaxID=2282167 RepID=A0A7C3ZI47_9CYAN